MTILDWADFLAGLLLGGGALALLWLRSRPAEPTNPVDEPPAAATGLLPPDALPLPDADGAAVADAVARAVDAYASYLIAQRDGAPAGVLRELTDAMYGDLTRSLTPPQLARALVAGLLPHADDRARALLDAADLSTAHLES